MQTMISILNVAIMVVLLVEVLWIGYQLQLGRDQQ